MSTTNIIYEIQMVNCTFPLGRPCISYNYQKGNPISPHWPTLVVLFCLLTCKSRCHWALCNHGKRLNVCRVELHGVSNDLRLSKLAERPKTHRAETTGRNLGWKGVMRCQLCQMSSHQERYRLDLQSTASLLSIET